jgi:hypothetical protein
MCVVATDMAMRPAEYQQRGHHDGASNFFSLGQIFGNRARGAGGLARRNPVEWGELRF